jgi:hypothetical protein
MVAAMSTKPCLNMLWILLQYLLLQRNVRKLSIMPKGSFLWSVIDLSDEVIEACECLKILVG